MAKVIGLVKSLENGIFFVKDAAGKEHQLQAGEQLHDGDLVYGDASNSKDAQIVVDETLDGSGTLIVAGNDALYFDTSVFTEAFYEQDSTIHINSLNEALATIASSETVSFDDANAGASIASDTTDAGETAAGTTVTDTARTGDTFSDRTGATGDVTTGVSSTDTTTSTPLALDTTNPVILNVTPVADAPTLSISSYSARTEFEEFGNTVGAYTLNSDVNHLTGGAWHTDNSVGGTGLLEIGQASTYLGSGILNPTNHVIELERNTGDKSNLYTNIDAKQGETYTVSFDYAPRTVGGALNSSVINVMWNGNIVKTLNTTTTGFQHYTVVLPVLVTSEHRLEFKATDSNSLGGVLDNIYVASNTGIADSSIDLSTIKASLTDSSETLSLTIDGIPAGWTLSGSDGTSVHSIISTGSTVNIDPVLYHLDTLSLTPVSGYVGSKTLTVIATSTESDGTFASSPAKTFDVTVLSNAGNDTVLFDPMATKLDAGAGMDTLVLSPGGDIDFSALGNVIKNIEIIDLSQNGAHTLDKLTVNDVLEMTDSSTHDLIILGDASDIVHLQDTAGGAWTNTGAVDTTTIVGHTLDIYTNSFDSTVQVKIEHLVSDTIVH